MIPQLCVILLVLQTHLTSAQDSNEVGCEEILEKVVPGALRHGGKRLPQRMGLGECKRRCVEEETDCVAVDWNYFSQECLVHTPETQGNTLYRDQPCCMHYTFLCAGPDGLPMTTSTTTTTTTTTTPEPTTSTPSTANPALPNTTTTSPPVPAGFVIPDGGCPDPFELLEDKEHGFSILVPDISDFENCKFWCLIRQHYCMAINFYSSNNTCYYLRELLPTSLTDKNETTFAQRTFCPLPLLCWNHEEVANDAYVTLSNPRLAVEEECEGACYVTATLGHTPTFDRGCAANVTEVPAECEVDEENNVTTCYCDTNRCNGLSAEALKSQVLYLPFDKDMKDHSGQARNGETTEGYTEPLYTCLYSAVNCSAVFVNSHCVSIPTLANIELGKEDGEAVVPMASYAVWFHRVEDGSDFKEGIFGNSATSEPSWQIVGQEDENLLNAAINTTGSSGDLEDFRFRMAKVNKWHLAVLTYDGFEDPEDQTMVPTTRFFIDGVENDGNKQADSGPIAALDEPVSVGCVGGNNFTGFIDEVRVFGYALKEEDILALMAMAD